MNDQRLEQLLSRVREVEDFERDLGLVIEPASRSVPLSGAPITTEFPRLHAGLASRPAATPGRRRWVAGPLVGPLVGVAGIAAAFALMVLTTRPAPVRVQPGHIGGSGTMDGPLASAQGGRSDGSGPNRLSPRSPRELLEGVSPFGSPMDSESLTLGDLAPRMSEPLWPRVTDVPQSLTDELTAALAAANAGRTDGAEHRNMVLAMYEGTDPATGRSCNQCQCVQYFNPGWSADRGVSEVSSGELIDATMDHACMSTPRRVFVIGLSGPADELPLTEDDARTIALCILGRAPDHTCSDRDTAMSSSAAACLSSNVAVRVQTWGK